MKKINFNKKIIITIGALLLLSCWFYWYEYRPAIIRINCSEKMSDAMRKDSENALQNISFLNLAYKLCLGIEGLKE